MVSIKALESMHVKYFHLLKKRYILSNSGFKGKRLLFVVVVVVLPIKLTPQAQHFKIRDHYIILSIDARTVFCLIFDTLMPMR